MNITIEALGKWSVGLRDWDKKEKDGTTSSISLPRTASELSQKGEECMPIEENEAYGAMMKKLGGHLINYRYMPISKDTVLGILAHCVGEVRPLREILKDPHHPITLIQDKVHFIFKRSSFQNEVVRLASPLKKSTNASGFLRAEKTQFPLVVDNAFSRCLYSVLDVKDTTQILVLLNKMNSGNPADIQSVLGRTYSQTINSDTLRIEMLKWAAITQKMKKDNNYTHFCKKSQNLMIISANDSQNIGGTLFLTMFCFIEKHAKKWRNEVLQVNPLFVKPRSQWHPKSALISGFKKATNSFNFRDYAQGNLGIRCKDKISGFVYQIENKAMDLRFFKSKNKINKNSNVGITRESGSLDIFLDLNPEDALKWMEWIEGSGVNVFQVGKKGLGYISKIWDPNF